MRAKKIKKDFASKIYLLDSSIENKIDNLFYQGLNLYHGHDINLALNKFQMALDLSLKYRYKKRLSKCFFIIASIYSIQKRYKQALQYSKQSLKNLRQIKDNAQEFKALKLMGRIYLEQCQYNLAINYYTKSLKIVKYLGSLLEEEALLNDLGVSHYYIGNYQQSIEYHSEQLEIAKTIGDHKLEASVLMNLGNVLQAQGGL